MYSQGPSYRTKPNDLSDPYETKFTARTLNDTAQVIIIIINLFFKYIQLSVVIHYIYIYLYVCKTIYKGNTIDLNG